MKKKKKGTTLVELIAVIAIMGLVSTIIYTLFGDSNKIFNKTQAETILQDEMRFLTTNLEDDIRLCDNKKAKISDTKEQVTFTLSTGSVFTVNFTSQEVLFAGIRNDEGIVYVKKLVDATLGTYSITKYKCSSTPSGVVKEEFMKFTSKVSEIICEPNTISKSKVYEIQVKLKDKKSNELPYKSTVYPRNG